MGHIAVSRKYEITTSSVFSYLLIRIAHYKILSHNYELKVSIKCGENIPAALTFHLMGLNWRISSLMSSSLLCVLMTELILKATCKYRKLPIYYTDTTVKINFKISREHYKMSISYFAYMLNTQNL